MISMEEFFKRINKIEGCDYIVRIRQRYAHEAEWRETNEVLWFAPEHTPSGCSYVWERDWDEGEDFCEVVGYKKIEDIMIEEVT